MNLPNGYRDETGTSYSDTWVHQDTPVTALNKNSFFTKEQWSEVQLHNQWMTFIKGKFNPPTFKEWLKTN